MSDTLMPLLLASAAFVGSHLALSATAVRRRLVTRLGRWGFTALYAVVAVVAFVWMSRAYARAPPVDLWPRADWADVLALVVMAPAAVLLVCGALTPNPTAVGGERVLRRGDPAPGIFKVTRHPVMWAVTLWAAVHALVAADAAGLIFFGAIGSLALAGMIHIDARRTREAGEDWRRLVAVTSLVPFAAAAQGRAAISMAEIGWWRIVLGVAVYAIFAFGHERLIGIAVIPW